MEIEEEGEGGKQGDKAKDPPRAEELTNQKKSKRPDRAGKSWRRRCKRKEMRRKRTGTERPHGGPR